MFHPVVPGGSSSSSSSSKGRSHQKHNGRKLLNFVKNQLPTSKPKPKIPPNATMGEIDKVLEDDELQLKNIKKELGNAQQGELKKIQQTLLAVQKEYNALHTENNRKEKSADALQTKLTNLTAVIDNIDVDKNKLDDTVAKLGAIEASAKDDLAAEMRSSKMLNFMVRLLDEELSQCRVEISKKSVAAEQAKHEVTVSTNNLLLNKTELLDQEALLSKIHKNMQSRKGERENKLSMLQDMQQDSKNAVTKLNSALEYNAAKSVRAISKIAGGKAGAADPNKAAVEGGSVGRESNAVADSDAEEITTGETVMQTDQDWHAIAQRMDITDLKNARSRWQTHSERIEKLRQQDESLCKRIKLQLERKKVLIDQLAQSKHKINQLASNRQIYQEVEAKDFALTNATKEHEDWKERTLRLQLNIESLKLSIPRFLTKVTKVSHTEIPATDRHLSDAIMKLEDEVVKLIKTTGVQLLKEDASRTTKGDEDLGAGEIPTVDAHSEFTRLQRLPGFARLQRQLFFNLMTAAPDGNTKNIRICSAEAKQTWKGPDLVDQTRARSPYKDAVSSLPNAKSNGAGHRQSSLNYTSSEMAPEIQDLVATYMEKKQRPEQPMAPTHGGNRPNSSSSFYGRHRQHKKDTNADSRQLLNTGNGASGGESYRTENEDLEEESLDRVTIKKISRLIEEDNNMNNVQYKKGRKMKVVA